MYLRANYFESHKECNKNEKKNEKHLIGGSRYFEKSSFRKCLEAYSENSFFQSYS